MTPKGYWGCTVPCGQITLHSRSGRSSYPRDGEDGGHDVHTHAGSSPFDMDEFCQGSFVIMGRSSMVGSQTSNSDQFRVLIEQLSVCVVQSTNCVKVTGVCGYVP